MLRRSENIEADFTPVKIDLSKSLSSIVPKADLSSLNLTNNFNAKSPRCLRTASQSNGYSDSGTRNLKPSAVFAHQNPSSLSQSNASQSRLSKMKRARMMGRICPSVSCCPIQPSSSAAMMSDACLRKSSRYKSLPVFTWKLAFFFDVFHSSFNKSLICSCIKNSFT